MSSVPFFVCPKSDLLSIHSDPFSFSYVHLYFCFAITFETLTFFFLLLLFQNFYFYFTLFLDFHFTIYYRDFPLYFIFLFLLVSSGLLDDSEPHNTVYEI